MNEFMNTFSKINESQFGFRQNSSTNDALNYLMENITNNLESNQLFCQLIYVKPLIQ